MSLARKQLLMSVLAALVLGVGNLASAGTATILAGDGTDEVNKIIPISIDLTALDLGGAGGVDGLTLNFSASDPGLSIGAFAPGPLLSGWLDVTSHPPFPSMAWSHITFGGGITNCNCTNSS